jgi:hypothetical protein
MGQHRPTEERGLSTNDGNHLVFIQGHELPVEEVLRWHKQVQQDVPVALEEGPEKWFSTREHRENGHTTWMGTALFFG